MPATHVRPAPARPDGRLALDLDGHRSELRHHCSRILGSAFEADDAVQETLVRAWRSVDRFDGRSSLRTWLYAIATNVCLSMRQAPQRRALPVGVAADAHAGGVDAVAADRCPGDTVAEREAVRSAFVVAVHRLPPRQRSVLVLRDVLQWRAAEVAELLGDTVASVNSALQRARATLGADVVAAEDLVPGDRPDGSGRLQQERLEQCARALERCDASALVALLG